MRPTVNLGVLFLLLAGCDSNAEQSGIETRPESVSFDQLTNTYESAVAELERERSRYFSSLPVYTEFVLSVERHVLPLLRRAETNRLRWVVLYPRLSEARKAEIAKYQEDFDSEAALMSLVWSIYGRIAPRVREIASPDWTEASSGQKGTALLDALIERHAGVPTLRNPLDLEIPFEKGTMEYAGFWTNVGEPLHMATGLLAHGIESSRPKSVREREKRVRDLHRALVERAGSAAKLHVPPEYRPSEWESLERSFDQIQRLTEAFWEEHRRGRKPVEQILEDLTPGKS